MKNITNRQLFWLKIGLFIVALLPFVRLAVAVVLNELGANPIEFMTRNTGDWTLYFLFITLAMTPLRKLLHWNWLIRLRRMLGLFTFFYASLHFLCFFWFDHFFDVQEMLKDVIKRPFIAVGFIAFCLLIPLAITSNNASIKKLGGHVWQLLHRAIYVIAPLAVLHYFWMKSGKNDVNQPLIFAGVLIVLLGLRIMWRYTKKT
jgi:sulfoxide reductase heme-binding subunit YedZ